MEEQDSAARPGTKAKDFGKLKHGCEHYRRRCKIRAPCCNQLFPCRHCHNEAASSLSNPNDRHELVRQDVKQVLCLICNTEQQVAPVCSNCGVNMGEYFCDTCKFYDDETEKEQFHCQQCGICRFFFPKSVVVTTSHCKKCGSCYPVDILDNHSCVENSMKNFCPVCYEYLFDWIKATKILKCRHTMHMDCFDDMKKQNMYRCPICSKTVADMSVFWKLLDEEIEATAMPEEYRYKVSILCNDCNNNGEACFHILGHKCGHCNSYNTRRLSAPDNC